MKINIVDTTLRDGEQKAGIAFSLEDKVEIAKMLDEMGVYQIEAGVAAMGGEEKKSIEKIAALGLKCRISSWNRMNIEDIKQSMDCGADIIHISVPSSDIQIKSKLGKDREWIKYNLQKTAEYVLERKKEVTIGFEDASRADINFLADLCHSILRLGVKRMRYADTVGILYPRKIYTYIKKIRKEVPIEIELHFHNDLGMAVANSIAAAEAGAEYVDCTINGIGERAGNCDFIKFAEAYNKFCSKNVTDKRIRYLQQIEYNINKVICNQKIFKNEN